MRELSPQPPVSTFRKTYTSVNYPPSPFPILRRSSLPIGLPSTTKTEINHSTLFPLAPHK